VRPLLCLFIALAGCFSGFRTADRQTETVGPGGGTVSVSGGSLAGFRLLVPPGALEEETEISVIAGREPDRPTMIAAGASARIEPMGIELSRTVEVELPFDSERVPLGIEATNLRVIWRGPDGREEILRPQVSTTQDSLLTPLPGFGTVWAVTPPGTNTGEFLDRFPLADGNHWEFSGDVAIDLTRAQPANFAEPVWEWTLSDAEADFGFYLGVDAGAVQDRGRFSATADLQEVLDFPLDLFPARLDEARVFGGQSDARVFSPLGSTTEPVVGTRASITRLVSEAPVFTPVGNFTSALQVLVEQTWEVQGLEGSLRARMWLVPGIGPVQLQLGTGSVHVLIRAVVDGQEIGLPSTGIQAARREG